MATLLWSCQSQFCGAMKLGCQNEWSSNLGMAGSQAGDVTASICVSAVRQQWKRELLTTFGDWNKSLV
jgi:hypothetical protein